MPRRKVKEVTTPQIGPVEQFRAAFEKSRRIVFAEIDDLTDTVEAIDVTAGNAPLGASYVTMTVSGALTDERILTAGNGIDITDGGAGGNATIDVDESELALQAVQYVVMATSGSVPNERVLTAGHGVDITDGGAGGNVTIDVDETEFTTGPGLITPPMLDNGGARSLLGRSANSAGARADISGAGTSTARQVPIDNGTTVAFGALTATDISDATLYDLDFTAQADNTFADGTETIDGFNWTIVNTSASNTFEIDNGVGLRFNAATTSTAFTNTTRTASALFIAVSTLIPSYSAEWTYVMDFYLSSATLGQAGNTVLVGILTNVAGTDALRAGGRRNLAAAQQTCTQQDATIVGQNYTNDAFGVKLSSEGVTTYSGTYAAGFPTPYANAGGTIGTASTGIANPYLERANSLFFIAFPTGEAGGAMDVTIARLRIRRIR